MANMDDHRGLREVRVAKHDLLKKMKENRSKHHEEYKVAHGAFRLAFLELAKELHTVALPKNWTEVEAVYDKLTSLDKPFERLETYDDAIALVEASIDENFVLPVNEFNNYWLDKWGWKASFDATNSSYQV